jgi:hypothetical protein
MSTASATVKIGASIQGLTQGLTQAKSALSSFAAQAVSVAGGQALFAGIQGAIGLVSKGVRGLGATFAEAVGEAGNFESIVAQFNTFYKDANLAAGAVAELSKYSATTAFQLEEVANAGAGLAAAGVPAEQLKETIRVLGDIAAGSKRPLAEILQPYVKTLSVGKLQTEGFLQFLERGIPLGEQLKKSLNLDDAGLTKALSSSAISAQDVVSALQEITKTGLFAGAAAAQGETLNGKLSTLSDTITEIKRNLGLAATAGLKPLIQLGTDLAASFAPIGTALGNIFSAASQTALRFADTFKTKFQEAVDGGIKVFQILEGAIRTGTLWDVLATSGKIAFGELKLAGIQLFQGLQALFEQGDLFSSLARISDKIIQTLIDGAPRIGAAFEGPVGTAFKNAANAFGSYLKEQIDFAVSGLADLVLPSFLSPGRADVTGAGMNKAGVDFSGGTMYASGGITDAQAAEMAAADAAGYPVPLRPSEVRQTFAGGRRITYNTRESLANGEIIPPSNSLAFAGGTNADLSRLADVFTAGATKQTDATKRLEASQKELRAELKRLAEAAIANSTAIKEQTSSLQNSQTLTAKTGAAEAPKPEGGAAGGGKEFTSLEKIGGGRRTLNLAPRAPMIGLEGTAPGLRAAGDLGGGFANSPAFEAAKKKAELLKIPIQGPPVAPFLQQQAAQQQIAPKPEVDPEVALRALMEEISRGLNGVTDAITRQGSLNVAVV